MLALTIAAGASQIQRNIIGERRAGHARGAALTDGPRPLRRPGRAARRHRGAARGPVRRWTACAGGFDRAMFDELADGGVFSLRADGFSLGRLRRRVRTARPVLCSGPLVSSLLLGRRSGVVDEAVELDGPVWVEHLDVLERSSCVRRDAIRRVDPAALDAEPVDVAARSAHADRARRAAPAGDADRRRRRELAPRRRRAHRRVRSSVSPIAAPRWPSSTRRNAMQFDRPIGVVPGDQAPLRRHARAHRSRARGGLRGRARTSTTGASRDRSRDLRRQGCSRARPRSRTGRPRRRCTAAWASPGRSTCTST